MMTARLIDAYNLISLCFSCNGRANYNRDYWEEYYKQILIKNNKI